MKKQFSALRNVVLIMALSLSATAFAEIRVTGTVSAADGTGVLPGVSVKVKETEKVSITDYNGQFSIMVPNESSTLIISYIGMKSEEVVVGNRTNITIKLTDKSMQLNDVVVIGYGVANRKDLTGSLSSINSGELMKSRSGSLMESMEGKLAGVQVTSNSGEPGSGVSISIRGGNSINAGTQPLYVIDGVQIDVNSSEVGQSSNSALTGQNPLSGLNPNDIESVDILKDASATAIYGSRGANGVIIITTKSGGKDAGSVNIDVYTGVSNVNKYISVLQGQDYANYRFARNPASTAWGTDTNGDGKLDVVKDYTQMVSHDWQRGLFRPGYTKSLDFSINSGQGSKLRFSTNIGMLNQQGIIENNSYSRLTARFKSEYDANQKLTFGLGTNISYTVADGAVVSNGPNSYSGLLQSFVLYNPFNSFDDPGNTDNGGLSSPKSFIQNAYKKTPLLRVMNDFSINYKILSNLILRLSINGGLTSSKGEEWYPTSTSWGYTKNGLAIISEASSQQWQTSNTLTYANTFAGGHYVNAMFGLEASEYYLSNLSVKGENFLVQTYNPVFDMSQASVYPDKPSSSKTKDARLSQFGRLNYILKDKYLFTASLRRDGSSKFGENNKYALFPSGAFAWKAHQEKFMKKQDVINELKLRLSVGATGNDRIDSYRALSRLDKAYYANFYGDNSDLGLAPSEIANPNLKWETTYQYDAGLDIQLLRNRIALTADVYYKDTRDMLLRAAVPGQSGSYFQWQNLGRISNKGIELSLTTTNISTKNFTWKSSLNFNINRNNVESLGSVSSVPVSISGGWITEVGRVLVGHPIGSGWGYVFDGIYQTTDFEADGKTLKAGVTKISGVTSQPGDMKFKDLGTDGVVDPQNDKTVISNSEPKHFGGFSNNLTYKNFDLSIFLQWSYGNQVMNLGRYRLEGYSPYYNVSTEYWQNAWTTTNPTNVYPAITGNGKIESSSYFVEDASYLRIKNVVLGYNLDSKLCKKLKIKSARIYLTGDNLFTFTKYTGYDPEVSYYNKLMSGVDNISYPRSYTYTIGCRLSF